MKQRASYLTPLFLIALVLAASFAHAQQYQLQSNQSLRLDLNPSLPQAFQKVTATVVSFAIDLNRAQIAWYRDGVFIASGTGKTTVSFAVGGIGSRTVIKARVTTPTSSVLETSSALTIADVQLLWSAFTSLPLGYQGKALASPNSTVRVTAFPFIPRIGGGFEQPQNLIFTWFLDDDIQGQASGRGENSFDFRTGFVPNSEASISVIVENDSKSAQAQKDMTVPILSPKLLLYTSSGGKMNLRKALDGVTLREKEEKMMTVQPYFYDLSTIASLAVKWLLDAEEVPTNSSYERTITIKAPQTVEQAFTQKLTINLTNPRNPYEETNQEFSITTNP